IGPGDVSCDDQPDVRRRQWSDTRPSLTKKGGLMSGRLRRALAASVLAIVGLVAIGVSPAAAITDGSADGNGHPYVGLMTAHAANGNYLWRCSGTLLNAHIFITAGHCTESPAAYAVVFFDSGPIIPDPSFTLVTRSCV